MEVFSIWWFEINPLSNHFWSIAQNPLPKVTSLHKNGQIFRDGKDLKLYGNGHNLSAWYQTIFEHAKIGRNISESKTPQLALKWSSILLLELTHFWFLVQSPLPSYKSSQKWTNFQWWQKISNGSVQHLMVWNQPIIKPFFIHCSKSTARKDHL